MHCFVMFVTAVCVLFLLMHGLAYMASTDKVDVDTFHKGIQYALEKLGKSKFGFERTALSNFKSKRHEGSGNELIIPDLRVLVLTKTLGTILCK